MKKLILSLIVLASASVFASDGSTTGCYDIAASVPGSFDGSEPGTAVLIKTNAKICVTESSLKPEDPDQMVSTGKISIKIIDGKKEIASYEMGAVSSEGALGTIYTIYGKTKEDVMNQDDDNLKYKLISFAMRNDHLKKGDEAGRVEINGNSLQLIQR